MRRFCLLPLLLICCLTLTACSRSRSEEAVRDFAARLNETETLSFTAGVRAEYAKKTARFTLRYEEDESGGRVTVLAPELIEVLDELESRSMGKTAAGLEVCERLR